MMILKTTVVVKPHLPLIHFRVGGMTREVRNGRENQQSKDDNKVSGPLQWWEVPDRFRRPVLDQAECEKINSGGAGIVWK